MLCVYACLLHTYLAHNISGCNVAGVDDDYPRGAGLKTDTPRYKNTTNKALVILLWYYNYKTNTTEINKTFKHALPTAQHACTHSYCELKLWFKYWINSGKRTVYFLATLLYNWELYSHTKNRVVCISGKLLCGIVSGIVRRGEMHYVLWCVTLRCVVRGIVVCNSFRLYTYACGYSSTGRIKKEGMHSGRDTPSANQSDIRTTIHADWHTCMGIFQFQELNQRCLHTPLIT